MTRLRRNRRAPMVLLALLALAPGLAGCTEPAVEEATDEGEYLVAGRLDEDITEAQVEEMRLFVEPFGAGLLVMESFPMRYQVRPLDADECPEVRAWLVEQPYVEIVGECFPIRDPLDLEESFENDPWWVPEDDA